MKSKFVLLFLLVAMLFPTTVFASNRITVFVDGNMVTFPSEPMRKDGVAMVPAQSVFSAMGIKVNWNSETEQMVITDDLNYIITDDYDFYLENFDSYYLEENLNFYHASYDLSYYLNAQEYTYILLAIGSTTAGYNKGQDIILPTSPQIINDVVYVPLSIISDGFNATIEIDMNTIHITSAKQAGNTVESYIGWPQNNTSVEIITETFVNETPESKKEWVSDVVFKKVLAYKKNLDGIDVSTLEDTIMPDFYWIYAFTERIDDVLYYVDEMTDEFFNAENAEATFNGIRMKKENGILYFKMQDLETKGLY